MRCSFKLLSSDECDCTQNKDSELGEEVLRE